jgi:hypothetical protein
VDSSYLLGARLGWLTNKSTSLICGEHAINETISANSFAVRTFSNRIFAFCFSVSEIGSGADRPPPPEGGGGMAVGVCLVNWDPNLGPAVMCGRVHVQKIAPRAKK